MDMTTYQTPQAQEGVDILGLVALLLITYLPDLSLVLVRWLG